MMFTVFCSIIVPVYNIEQYVERCIQSVLSQTSDDYELILVDDGSKDDSGIICDKFANSYSQKIRVIHKENGGLSETRNAGVQSANGEYIVFLDGDDYIASWTIQRLKEASVENPDVILSEGMVRVENEIEKKDCPFSSETFIHISGIEALTKTAKIKRNWSACGKAFRTAFWNENGFSFACGRNWEDFQLIDKVVINARTVNMIPAFYYYVERKGSISKSISERDIRDLMISLGEWEEYLDESTLDAGFIKVIKGMHARLFCETVMGYVFLIKTDNRKKIIQIAKKFKDILIYSTDIKVKITYKLTYIIGFSNTCRIIGVSKRIRGIVK